MEHLTLRTPKRDQRCTPNWIIILGSIATLLIQASLILAQPFEPGDSSKQLKIASCQFPVSRDIAENASWIKSQIREAAGERAEVVHFPECALSGYPGVDLMSMDDYPWDSLRLQTEAIMDLARDLGVWVLLGSIHPLGDGLKPMNSLYVIDDSGRIVDRYDKRFCTKGDLDYFSAGDHFVVFDLHGIRCGLLICFDIRFPELYREYCKLEADIIFQSFYNARQKPGGIHPRIMPVTAQGHAGINHVYMSLTNSSAPSSWPCHFITPDGLIQSKLEPDTPGILISEIDLSDTYYDASRDLREEALKGKLSSEEPPVHPRNSNRTIL
jgi:predicted amidohydrolase